MSRKKKRVERFIDSNNDIGYQEESDVIVIDSAEGEFLLEQYLDRAERAERADEDYNDAFD